MQEYLLDTNAYFKVLCYVGNKINPISEETEKRVNELLSSKCYISKVTIIEIMSVIGKHARGKSKSCEKCNRVVSEDGEICGHNHFTFKQKAWTQKQIKDWIKLSTDITVGRSPLLFLEVINLDDFVFSEAEKIIESSTIYSFASMDSIIAATASCLNKDGKNISVVTSDKSLKKALTVWGIPFDDSIKDITYKTN